MSSEQRGLGRLVVATGLFGAHRGRMVRIANSIHSPRRRRLIRIIDRCHCWVGSICDGRRDETNHADCVESGCGGIAHCVLHIQLRGWFSVGRFGGDQRSACLHSIV
jgi:hypothetical protein